MGAVDQINKRNRLRNQINRQEQSGYVGDPYFNAARKSLQSGFRFLLRVQGVPFALVADVDRPNPTFGAPKEFQLLNWKFKYPVGPVTWNNISFTLREIFDNSVMDSVAGIILNKYKLAGYDNPFQVDPNNLKDMSKSALMESLGVVIIEIIDADGNVYEQWRLYGAFISGVTFSKLSYSTSSLLGTTIQLTYDWATLTYTNETGMSKTY